MMQLRDSLSRALKTHTRPTNKTRPQDDDDRLYPSRCCCCCCCNDDALSCELAYLLPSRLASVELTSDVSVILCADVECNNVLQVSLSSERQHGHTV